MPADSTITAVLAQFGPSAQPRQVQSLAGAGGWSGSQIWRIATADGRQLCLRRWPREHPSRDRLELIHAILTHVAGRGIEFIPAPLRTSAGPTIAQAEDHLWELTPWLPGSADFHQRPIRPRLAAAMQALARFHAAAALLPLPLGEGWGEGLRSSTAPAIQERIHLLDRQLAGEYVDTALILETPAKRILDLTRDRLVPLRCLLSTAAERLLQLQPAIRDIHHDHVLFTGDEVTGLIDFGAMRIDTPLADIARLVGSLVADDRAAREFALDAYSQIRPLSEPDRRLIGLLDASNVVLGALNWLRWLYIERRQFEDLPAVIRRMDELIARLERAESGTP